MQESNLQAPKIATPGSTMLKMKSDFYFRSCQLGAKRVGMGIQSNS